MAQTDDRADLREIRANVQKLDDELDGVRLGLAELTGQVTTSSVATALALKELKEQVGKQTSPSALTVIAQACSNPTTLGQILVILSAAYGLVAGTGYAAASTMHAPAPVMVPVPVTVPEPAPELKPWPPIHVSEEDTDHAQP